jgi:hypothetical protein
MKTWVDAARKRASRNEGRCSDCLKDPEDCGCAERTIARALDLVTAADDLVAAVEAGRGVPAAIAWYRHTRGLP